ncbi:MAG TPA: hypothetical protein VGC54_01100 [Planctomycetota bacterium]
MSGGNPGENASRGAAAARPRAPRGRLTPADLPLPFEGLRYEIVDVDQAPRLNGFFNLVFGQQRPDEVAAWKYFGATPAMPAVGMATEIDSGRVVAMHPSVVRRLWACGKEHLVYQAGDVAIAPDFRRGMQLYKQFVHWVQWTGLLNQGVMFGYGGRVTSAHRRLGKRLLGYEDLLALPIYDRRLSPRATVKRRLGAVAGAAAHAAATPFHALRHVSGRRGVGVREFEGFDERHDALWARLRDRYQIALVRDRAVLDWRYGRNPVGIHRFFEARRGGELAAWGVLRCWNEGSTRIGTVIDLCDGHDAELAAALIQAASAEARRQGCDFLRVAPQAGSAAAKAVAGLAGFFPGRAETDQVIFKVLPPDPAAYGAAELAAYLVDGAHWSYAQGDSDYRE